MTFVLFLGSLHARVQAQALTQVSAKSQARAPVSTDLRETGPGQRRDLSIPGSRIVLNPYNFRIPPGKKTAVQYSNGPDLPLNAGYLGSATSGHELDELLLIYRKQDKGPGKWRQAWQADTRSSSFWGKSDQLILSHQSDGLNMYIPANATSEIQSVHTSAFVEADLNKTPLLELHVPGGEALWAVKVHAEGAPTDVTLRYELGGNGVYHFDIPALTGWTGYCRFRIHIYMIGKEKRLTLGDMRLTGSDGPLEEARQYSTSWEPHALSFKARWSDGSRLRGHDFFFNENVLVRTLIPEDGGQEKEQAYIIGGKFHGEVRKPTAHMLTIKQKDISYAVSFGKASIGEFRYYSSYSDMRSGKNALVIPKEAGYWTTELRIPRSETAGTPVSVAFASNYLPEDSLLQRVSAPFTSGKHGIGNALQARIDGWDQLLEQVPHPKNFSLEEVPSMQVTPEQVRAAYYKAWCFLAMNVLPPDPLYFPYRQIVTGKGSLWSEGHPFAPFSAAWESFIGIQLYAHLDPEAAADAFKGLLSLIDETGLLGGESLPSRKAQTAWLLYQKTADKALLQTTYAALKRYMAWRLQYPQWVYKDVSMLDPTKKDAEFVVSALIDITYLIRITKELGFPGETAFWNGKRKDLFGNYLRWFWESSRSVPVQMYNTRSGQRSSGHTIWVTTGLNVDLLEGEYLQSMIRYFRSVFRPEKTFGGFPMPKYPDMAFTVRGLLKKGLKKEAQQLMEVNIRDVVRSGAHFSEQYTIGDQPFPDGVRPSLFGMAQLIDFVLLKNGVDYLTTSGPDR